jgi:hypothetical protein
VPQDVGPHWYPGARELRERSREAAQRSRELLASGAPEGFALAARQARYWRAAATAQALEDSPAARHQVRDQAAADRNREHVRRALAARMPLTAQAADSVVDRSPLDEGLRSLRARERRARVSRARGGSRS